MSYTKKQIINLAFDEIGIGDYEFDTNSAEQQSALKKLDLMMGTWASKGINIGYPINKNPKDSNINQDTNVSEFYIEAIYLNLAIRVAPIFGKSISIETRKSAKESYSELLRSNIDMTPQQLNILPRGQGQKQWRYGYHNRFINPKDNSNDLGQDDSGNLNL